MNRVGFEGPPDHGLEFWGSSFVADPFGQVIAEASTSNEEILVVECDPHRMEEVRRNWPFLRDRRIDAYAPISEAVAGLKPKLGLRMPAEWEPHEATWLAWPHERTDWPGKFAPIPWVYGDIVRRLARVERVRILVEDAALEKSARRVLAKCAREHERRRVLPLAHQSKLDARLLPDLRSQSERRGRHHKLAFQRLGEVRQLARRQPHPGTRGQARQAAANSSPALCSKAAASMSTARDCC